MYIQAGGRKIRRHGPLEHVLPSFTTALGNGILSKTLSHRISGVATSTHTLCECMLHPMTAYCTFG